MAKVRRLSPLLALALLLAACAPAATGTSPGAPYPIHSRSIVATAGTAVYVEADFTLDDFGIDPTKLTGALWVPSGYNSESAVITTKFGLDHVRVPADWRLELVQVQATRATVQGPTSFSKSTVKFAVTTLLRVTPKADAIAGPYHLLADLTYQTKSRPLTIDLHVQ